MYNIDDYIISIIFHSLFCSNAYSLKRLAKMAKKRMLTIMRNNLMGFS